MKTTNKAEHLTSQICTEFGMVKAQRKELEKLESTFSSKIKKLIVMETDSMDHRVTPGTNGNIETFIYSPQDSPFQLVYSKFPRQQVSWADEFQKLYTKLYGDAAYQKFLNELPLGQGEQLNCQPNPYYIAKEKVS